MKEYGISVSDAGRRLDRFCESILAGAPSSFIYKMLRKKNIVLNDKKAEGKETLQNGDTVKFYLADDTFSKFSKKHDDEPDLSHLMPPVVYEDADILIVNKPSGMLTQKSAPEDISLNEICLSYVTEKKESVPGNDMTFTPSVCNRLDRNTSGLVTFAKTYRAARFLTSAFRDRTIHKFYDCIVVGKITEDMSLSAKLSKDAAANKVTIGDEGRDIITNICPVRTNDTLTYVKVQLITGRPHQIRAHLASVGHPLIGDGKYGDANINSEYKKKYGLRHQLLCCTKLVFPGNCEIQALSGKEITISVPDIFNRVM